MKILKWIGIVLLCLIAIPLIIALFVPNDFTVSVKEVINQPKENVFNYVRILNNQPNYNIWVMEDPNLKIDISGTDGSVGAIQKWNSEVENVGEGEQEIVSLSSERMDVDLRFKRPFKGEAKAAYLFKSLTQEQTEVTAEFYSKGSYPMNLMAYMFGRKMIREAQEKNLKNLKTILEKE